MINKYAEIQDRILLYNACKGILRVKTAGMGKQAIWPILPAIGGAIMKAAPVVATLGSAAMFGLGGLQQMAAAGSNAKNIQQGLADGAKYLFGGDEDEKKPEAAAAAAATPAAAAGKPAAAPAAAAQQAADPFDDEFEGMYAGYQQMSPMQQKTLLKNLVRQQMAARSAAAGAAAGSTAPARAVA